MTQAPPQSRPDDGLGKKLLAGALVGVLVFAGLSLYGDVQALIDNLTHYRWLYFVAGLVLATLNYVIRFFRWEYYLRLLNIEGVPTLSSARIFFAGFVMSVTPGKVGEVFKSWLLEERHGVPLARTAPIVVAERLTDLLALVLLAAIGSLVFPDGWAISVVGAVFVLGAWVACMWKPLGMGIIGIVAKIPALAKLAPKLREAYDALQLLVRPKPLIWATLFSTVAWGLEVVSLYIIARGFTDIALGWLASTFAYAVPTIVGALAMMPGGLGVTEAGMTGVLVTVSEGAMSDSVATATTILVRLATLWWAVILGALALAWHRQTEAPQGNAPKTTDEDS